MNNLGSASFTPSAYSGEENSNHALLTTSDSPSTIRLPTYISSFKVEQQNPRPLVHLHHFDALRATVTQARQYIFAHRAQKQAIKVQNRVELTGDERSFDYTLAIYFYGRDISGDFGVRQKAVEGVPKKSNAETVEFLLKDRTAANVLEEAEKQLAEIEKHFRAAVLVPLEEQLVGKGGNEGGGMLRRMSSGFGSKGVNYEKLGKQAGPLILEAKEIHMRLERVVLEVLGQ
jgi:hypothetical protein